MGIMREHSYDLAVIGGGPAGMMAAAVAAEGGAKVVLIEKNNQLGKKLLLTGKGRCNLTAAQEDLSIFIDFFGKNGKFLYPSLNAFGISDTVSFFNEKGLETKVERGKRVFPKSDKSEDVLKILMDYLKKNKVGVLYKCKVQKLVIKKSLIQKLITSKGEIKAKKYIIASGGLSYPSTGSSGDGYSWVSELGHTIIKTEPSLVPIKLKENWARDLEGLSLKNVAIRVFQNNKKKDERFGETLFTKDGLSGPIILDMSKEIGKLLKEAPVELQIDFKPALSFEKLDKRIQRDFLKNSNKMFKNSLDDLLPQKLIAVIIWLSGIDPEKKVNHITTKERSRFLHLLKELKVAVSGLYGFEKAVITAGGVSLKEIDPQTLCSKLINNLYFAGEILDLDGPTGGFNLQICWSTGYLAGKTATQT
ncbi:MAG: NAD(P)/FAD-dependent oxidoreductase [Candidatus Saganbacteria bacterium]|nr:NAD(P)/FAD-dependent oxidoreductase [Candidatus Saganbacteria bacterium]